MKEKQKNAFVLGAISIIIAFIIIAFRIGFGETSTLILQPGTTDVVENTQNAAKDVIENDFIGTVDEGLNNGTPTLGANSFSTSEGNILELYGFAEEDVISTPLVFAGSIPSDWVFEGAFTLNLLTKNEEIIKEGYGEANIFDEYGEINPGNVDFTVKMDFELPNPEEAENGILRFSSANPNLEDSVDVMVLFK